MGRKKLSMKDFLIKYALFILIILLWCFYGYKSPYFFTVKNVRSLLVNAAPLLIYASGMTFILILGEIDLSIGAVGAVSATAWILAMKKMNLPLWAAFILAILIGAVCGAVTGFLVTRLKINAFMVTLGMQFFLRGICYYAAGGAQILTPEPVHEFMRCKPFRISILVYISIFVAVIMTLIYRYTSYGRKIQACGCNKKAAVTVGINVNKTKFIAFVLCGALAGLAGTLQCTNVGMLIPGSIGDGSEFLAITTCVLGGTSLAGGIGSIIPGTLIGVIFYYSIENGLGLLGANVYLYPIVRGIVIYLAMVTDSLKRTIRIRKE